MRRELTSPPRRRVSRFHPERELLRPSGSSRPRRRSSYRLRSFSLLPTLPCPSRLPSDRQGCSRFSRRLLSRVSQCQTVSLFGLPEFLSSQDSAGPHRRCPFRTVARWHLRSQLSPPCPSASSPLRRGMISSAPDFRCLSLHQTLSSPLQVGSRRGHFLRLRFSWAFLGEQLPCPERCP